MLNLSKYSLGKFGFLSKALAVFILGSSLVGSFTGCSEKGSLEKAGESADEAIEDAGDAVEDAGDDISDKTSR